MNKAERISKALKFLERNGYVLHATSPKRGIDLIVFKDNDPQHGYLCGGDAAQVQGFPDATIQEQARGTPLPLSHVGCKQVELRYHSLMSGASKWIGEVEWKGNIRFDTVTVHDTNGLIDHIENAIRAEGR